MVAHVAVIRPSSSLHFEVCKALRVSDGVVNSSISYVALCLRAAVNTECEERGGWYRLEWGTGLRGGVEDSGVRSSKLDRGDRITAFSPLRIGKTKHFQQTV